MRFSGIVDEIRDIDFAAYLTPDDGAETESWIIYKNQVPPDWLAVGAVFWVDVEENGRCRWTFEKSVWTKEMVDHAEQEGKKMYKKLNKRV